jgi:hypothetical protein
LLRWGGKRPNYADRHYSQKQSIVKKSVERLVDFLQKLDEAVPIGRDVHKDPKWIVSEHTRHLRLLSAETIRISHDGEFAGLNP